MTVPWTLAGALAESEKVAAETLNTENRALRDALTHLQAQFEVSQKLADVAIKERDHFSRQIGAMGVEHLRNRGALIREIEQLKSSLALARSVNNG